MNKFYFDEAREEKESILVVSRVSGRSFINPSRTPLLARVPPFRPGSLGRAEGEFPRFAEGHSDAHLSRLELNASVEGTSELGKEQGHQVQEHWRGMDKGAET